MVPNTDQRSGDYSEMSAAYRPSHADATYDMKCVFLLLSFFSKSFFPVFFPVAKRPAREKNKTQKPLFPFFFSSSTSRYGIRAVAGGGRSSARETVGRVAAGAVAKKLLAVVGEQGGTSGGSKGQAVEVLAYVSRVRDVGCEVDDAIFTLEQVESNPVRFEFLSCLSFSSSSSSPAFLEFSPEKLFYWFFPSSGAAAERRSLFIICSLERERKERVERERFRRRASFSFSLSGALLGRPLSTAARNHKKTRLSVFLLSPTSLFRRSIDQIALNSLEPDVQTNRSAAPIPSPPI